MRAIWIRTAAASALLALAASACGVVPAAADGDDAPPPDPTSGLSKKAWVTAAEEICADLTIADLDVPTTYSQAKRYATRALRRVENALVQIYSLDPPASDREQIDAFLSKWDLGLAHTRNQTRAVLLGDEEGLRIETRAAARAFAEGNRLARRYGLRVCSGDQLAPSNPAGDSTTLEA